MKKTKNNIPVSSDKAQYSVWQALYLSFFSPRIYVDVGKRWQGLCLRYLLLLIFLITLPFVARIQWAAFQYYQEHLLKPLQASPTIYIRDGVVEFDHFMPYRINNDRGETVALIDTTGYINRIDRFRDPELTWLVTRNALTFRPPPLKVSSHFTIPFKSDRTEIFSDDLTDVVEPKDLVDTVSFKVVVCGFILMVYPCVALMLYVFIVMLVTAFTWAAQYYVRAVFRYQLEFKVIYRLLILALTPPLTCALVLGAFDIMYMGSRMYYLIFFAIYFNLGVLALRRADHTMVIA